MRKDKSGMVLVKAPLRLSFFGGGSDIPGHFMAHGGATLSAAFNKYVHVAIAYTPTNHIKVAYSDTQYATTFDEIRHDIVRETLKTYHWYSNVEITSFADIPTVGTGLGASSAFTAALVRGIEHWEDRLHTSASSVAKIAANIEINKVGAPIGYQDHYSAALGGINFIEYGKNVNRIEVILEGDYRRYFESCLFLVKVPTRTVSANEILSVQMDPTGVSELAGIARAAFHMRAIFDITDFGRLLHESWLIKKKLHANMSTSVIDDIYEAGIKAGLLGGKLLGAGNGGYLLFCAPSPHMADKVIEGTFAGETIYKVSIADEGAQVVYDSRL